ncbi:hypothetical protein BDV11DRAFT_173912 [Aspergillus similis]
MGPVVDKIGRRTGVLISVFLKFIGIALMTSAQGVDGWPRLYLQSYRASGLSFIFTVYYVGALLAAGVTYATANYTSSWSWRLPCLLQALFSVLCFFIIFFVPESPRWLAHRERVEDALISVASTHSNSDITDAVAIQQHRYIIDMIELERASGKQMTYAEIFQTPNSRRRLLLVISIAVLSMSSGNNIVSYYLGDMLDKAGITNETTQLQINIILTAWCLVIACLGTWLVNNLGRKPIISVAGMIVFLYLVGAFTKLYGNGGNTSGIYGTVAAIFLFQGSYAIGITPLTIIYAPEVLNFSIRSNGMAAWTFSITCGGLFSVFVWPLALEAIGYKTYLINATWNVVQFVFVAYFWIETKGLTLEQIDAKFESLNPSILDGVEAEKQMENDTRVTIVTDGTKKIVEAEHP